MFYSEKKGQGLYALRNRDVSGILEKRSAPRIISRKFKNLLKSGEAPVYPDCLTAEQWEKSAETRRCRMRLATGLREATILKHLLPDWRLFGRPGPGSLPYGFHDEANDHRQSHTAAHRTDDDGCDFTCRGGARRAASHGCLQINYRRRRKSEIMGRNRLLVWEGFRCVLTRGELLPRLCNKWKEINEWDCRVLLCTAQAGWVILSLCWQQAGSRVVTKPFALWPSGLPVHSLATTHRSDKWFLLRCRVPHSHLHLSIRCAGQQYSRCFFSVNPPL